MSARLSRPPEKNLGSAGLDAGRCPARMVAMALAIFAVAFGLRVWNLAGQSFWWDEAYSTMVASQPLRDLPATLVREDFHPPLHYVILHYWMRLAGSGEFSVRFVSVWAGVLAVAAAWATARRLIGRDAGPVAAAIVALSPFLWYYSQEARMFAPVPVLGLLALYFCARGVEEGGRVAWVGYAAAIVLGLYDFYYTLFLPFVCGLWILVGSQRRRAALARWAIATAAAFALYLPWMPIFLAHSAAWSGWSTPSAEPLKVIVWSWPQLLFGLPTLDLYQQPLPAALLGAGALATLVGLTMAWRLRRTQPSFLLAALAFLLPFLAIAAISTVKTIFHPRYITPVAPGLYLILAGLLVYAFRARKALAWRGLGVALALLLAADATFGFDHLLFDPRYTRDDYRAAIASIQSAEQPGDAIVDNAIPPVWYYYHGLAPTTYIPTGAYTEAAISDELNAITRGHPRLWYLEQITIPNDPDGYITSQLDTRAQIQSDHQFGPVRVRLWQIPRDNLFAAVPLTPVSLDVGHEFTLTGYGVAGEPVGGQTIDVELAWTTQRAPSSDDGFWVGLADAAGRLWGRADARPRDAAYKLTSGWTAGEMNLVRFSLPVAVGTPPGHYQLVGGVYRLRDLVGLNVLDASGHALGQQAAVGTVDVTRVTAGTTDPSLANHAAQAVQPGLALAGYQLDGTTLAPGDRLPATLLWRASAALPPLSASLRLQGADGRTIVGDDGPVGGSFPTPQWPLSGLVREQRALILPASAPAGSARVVLVVGDTAIDLGAVTVREVARDFQRPTTAHPLAARFADTFALAGYDLSRDPVRAGDDLTVTLAWQSVQATLRSYRVFVHLLDAQNHVVAQWDGVPRNWTYPTSAWLPGEYVVDRYPLKVPPGTPPGNLTLEVGLYDADSGQRLPVVATAGGPTDDRIVLQQVHVGQ
jgi:mannosyltransferase